MDNPKIETEPQNGGPRAMLSGGGAIAVLFITMMAMVFGIFFAIRVGRSTNSPQIVRLSLGSGGFMPEAAEVETGRPVELRIFRKDAIPCTSSVVLEDLLLTQALAPNKSTAVLFTPNRQGNYTLRCGMGCWRATLKASERDGDAPLAVSE